MHEFSRNALLLGRDKLMSRSRQLELLTGGSREAVNIVILSSLIIQG